MIGESYQMQERISFPLFFFSVKHGQTDKDAWLARKTTVKYHKDFVWTVDRV